MVELITFDLYATSNTTIFIRQLAPPPQLFPASGRIMEKIGMIQEGLLKDQIMKDGRYEDLIYFGLINPYEDRN